MKHVPAPLLVFFYLMQNTCYWLKEEERYDSEEQELQFLKDFILQREVRPPSISTGEHQILAEAKHLSRQPCRRTRAEYQVANVTELCSFSSLPAAPAP